MTPADPPLSPTAFTPYRKTARRLIPFLFVLYLVAFIDRVNVGFAKLQMAGDLGLSESDFGLGAGIFFLSYFVLEVPSNLLLLRFGPRLAFARIVLLWGCISVAMALVHDKWSFYGTRLALGAAEAGFFPGVILYLTFWFPAQQRARSTALFMTALAIAGVIGGPLSGLIMEKLDGWTGLRGWQWLFILEGAPAILMGIACLWFLDDAPTAANWLTEDEKRVIQRDLEADRRALERAGHEQDFLRGLINPQLWLLALVYMLLVTGIYGVSFWLPQIVHDLEQGGLLMTGGLSMIPYLCACAAMVLVGRSSDLRDERRWHVAGSALAGGMGLAVCGLFVHAPVPAIAGLSLATAGIFAALATFWSLPTAFLSGTAAAGGIALINAIGNLGGYLGPVMVGWARQLTGSVESGLLAIAAGLLLTGVLLISLPSSGATRGMEGGGH